MRYNKRPKLRNETKVAKYFIVESFKLHDGQLENWKKLSREIDTDIAKAEGFISRDSGIDADNLVYCLVKWQSKSHQKAFMKQLEARDGWDDMMMHFASIADMQTEKRQEIEIF